MSIGIFLESYMDFFIPGMQKGRQWRAFSTQTKDTEGRRRAQEELQKGDPYYNPNFSLDREDFFY